VFSLLAFVAAMIMAASRQSAVALIKKTVLSFLSLLTPHSFPAQSYLIFICQLQISTLSGHKRLKGDFELTTANFL
jgi:hypothetical protein